MPIYMLANRKAVDVQVQTLRWQTGLKFEASLPIRAQVDRAPQGITPRDRQPKAGKPPPKQSKIAKPGQNLASLKFLVKIQNLRMRSDAVKNPLDC